MAKAVVLIAGDTHGSFDSLHAAIRKFSPLLVLQCGDFGYWPDYLKTFLPERGFRDASDRVVPVHFCDGNHEHHRALGELRAQGEPPYVIGTGIVYQPRGSVLTLPDGRIVLFCGGARSIDKQLRLEGWDWFPEEQLTEEEFAAFPDLPSVDVVISHAAPACIPLPFPLREENFPDPTRTVLDKVLYRYRPGRWYCGHYHRDFSGDQYGCRITALDCVRHPLWRRWHNPRGIALLEMD